MSFENPTRLRLGMPANFGGKWYRVAGRVVLGVTDDGATYYWNEFNLESTDGSAATLVYEETERGGEWRLFTMFEPEYPITAADAATKQVGDVLNLTGTDVRVTLLDTSRVYHIEGRAPEGVAVGEQSNYFNAEAAGGVMQVVSWTGDEVECYNGVNLSRGVVKSAFNLPQEPDGGGAAKVFSSLSGTGSGYRDSGVKFAMNAAVFIFLFYIVFGRNLSCSTNYQSSPDKHLFAGPPPLAVGATGRLNGRDCRITAHAVVEIARVGLICERHEYELAEANDQKALLVCGDQPSAKNWMVYEPLTPGPFTPGALQMATNTPGNPVTLDGFTGKVTDLFRSTIKQSDGDGWFDQPTGTVSYGLGAISEFQLHTLLARWNGQGITCYVGQSLPAAQVQAGFPAAK